MKFKRELLLGFVSASALMIGELSASSIDRTDFAAIQLGIGRVRATATPATLALINEVKSTPYLHRGFVTQHQGYYATVNQLIAEIQAFDTSRSAHTAGMAAVRRDFAARLPADAAVPLAAPAEAAAPAAAADAVVAGAAVLAVAPAPLAAAAEAARVAEADGDEDAADAADDATPNGIRFNAFMLRGQFSLAILDASAIVYEQQRQRGNPDPQAAARNPEFLIQEFAVAHPRIVTLTDIRDYVIGRIQQVVDRDL